MTYVREVRDSLSNDPDETDDETMVAKVVDNCWTVQRHYGLRTTSWMVYMVFP